MKRYFLVFVIVLLCFTSSQIQAKPRRNQAPDGRSKYEEQLIRDDRELFMRIADDWDSGWDVPYSYEKRSEFLRKRNEHEKRYMDVDRAEEEPRSKIPLPGDLFEGDIVMDESLRASVLGDDSKRDSVRDETYLWGDGYVPFELSDELSDDTKDVFHRAVDDFNTHTCIRFVPRTTEVDFLFIFPNASLCYSSVGKHGGMQKVSLGDGCAVKGIIIHELLHTLGFVHEQSRPDRDKYIEIMKDNIKPELLHNFQKFSHRLVENLGTQYDFDSVLHYNNHAFSKNGEDTIRSLRQPDRRFGQREGFSRRDLVQVNRLYKCEEELRNKRLLDDIMYD
uniref:Metalloendopeptidase n=1 Tax=Isarachnanthus nocturnus TaxID=1240238 RepID=A0A7G7WYS3_9CNID|nr:toxin candidate TRINITY_DN1936_c0_g1_i1 [Isarachnanthus nocturnus]